MAQSLVHHQDIGSNDNSVSTREFLSFEKACEAYKDSDDEIKLIMNEINKLSASNNKDNVIVDDTEDVDLILKRAKDIAHETENLLKRSPVPVKGSPLQSFSKIVTADIPEITVTNIENESETHVKATSKDKVRCFKYLYF